MIALIAAYSKNRVIGDKGVIPWNIEGEKKRFKDLTMGNVIIMGRRTYEEIGKPLPGRYTIVVSTTKSFEYDNCTTVVSLKEAIELAREKFGNTKDIYVSGGARLYTEALEIVQKMYISEIDIEIKGDTYFPEFDESKFEKSIDTYVYGEIPYTYVTYIRK